MERRPAARLRHRRATLALIRCGRGGAAVSVPRAAAATGRGNGWPVGRLGGGGSPHRRRGGGSAVGRLRRPPPANHPLRRRWPRSSSAASLPPRPPWQRGSHWGDPRTTSHTERPVMVALRWWAPTATPVTKNTHRGTSETAAAVPKRKKTTRWRGHPRRAPHPPPPLNPPPTGPYKWASTSSRILTPTSVGLPPPTYTPSFPPAPHTWNVGITSTPIRRGTPATSFTLTRPT